MTTLKEARKKGELEKFIKEHEEDAPGDQERLEKTIQKALDKSKSTQETSKKDSP